jgi:hypothetical protein
MRTPYHKRVSRPAARFVRRGEGAQGVIEFALILTVLMLVFLGTVDFSRAFYYQTGVDNGARVAAEAAINHCYSHSSCGAVSTASTVDDVLWSAYCEAKQYLTLKPTYAANSTKAPSTGVCALPPGQTLSSGAIIGDACATGCSGGSGANCTYDTCVKWYTCASSGFSDNLSDGTCVAAIGSVLSGVALTSAICTSTSAAPTGYSGSIVTIGGASYCKSGTASPSSTGAQGAGVYIDAGYNFQPISFVISAFFTSHSCWFASSAWSADSQSQNKHTLCGESAGRVS